VYRAPCDAEHVEKVLNHTIDEVAEIYDRHDYSAEKRAALERLAEYLKKLLCDRSNHIGPHAGNNYGALPERLIRSAGGSAIPTLTAPLGAHASTAGEGGVRI
jgi:hypothetical protein